MGTESKFTNFFNMISDKKPPLLLNFNFKTSFSTVVSFATAEGNDDEYAKDPNLFFRALN